MFTPSKIQRNGRLSWTYSYLNWCNHDILSLETTIFFFQSHAATHFTDIGLSIPSLGAGAFLAFNLLWMLCRKAHCCCCTTCLGPCLAPASPHLCWQGISCALRQISKQRGSLVRSASGKRYCFMFSMTLAMVGRERKRGSFIANNYRNKAHSNSDSRRRRTK